MKKTLLTFTVLAVISPFFFGCTTSTNPETGETEVATTLGDGVFDTNEQALFKAAVGTTLSIQPELATPVYSIASTALGITSGTAAEILDAALVKANIDLQLDSAMLAMVNDYLDVLKVKMDTILASNGVSIDLDAYGEIVNQMLLIVQKSAKARII